MMLIHEIKLFKLKCMIFVVFITSVTPVQCPKSWGIRPTGNWSLGGSMITTQTDPQRHLLLVRVERHQSLFVVFTNNNITVQLTAENVTINNITFSVTDLGIL